MSSAIRAPHAVQDLPSRYWKGEKILRLLDLPPREAPWRVLEVGTGSGGIAHYLATHPTVRCHVTSVDVVDVRTIHDGYAYALVGGTTLPFADASFDVVITNHVIEHVGDQCQQGAHLKECRRVLAVGGRGYLAVPNRWMLVEPHYQLPFLSWLPHGLRTPYLRVMGRGQYYDCEPLTQRALESLLRSAGLQFENVCIRALRATFDIESPHDATTRILRNTPDAALRPLTPLTPTLIYRFTL